jgi:Mn-dependent DtxR family transcriptional regulator
MPASRPRRFCQALLEETGGEVPRWVSITAIAGQLGLEQEEAEALGTELDELDLVRVGGGHSVWLTERGRQACQRAIKKSDVLRPSRGSGTGRAKVPGGRSRC